MTYTLEDYLLTLHKGSWFGFNNLNGNDANKTYANLVIHSDDTKPTEQECDDGVTSLQAEYDLLAYSRQRQQEYPSIQECIHAILDDDLTALQVKRQAVKDKYPKGGN
jgi:hypothetical protein